MKIAIIAALAHDRVIGKDGKLPWHISDDLKRFKRLTTGHAILMGRKTFESLGRPLPNRRNVVLTSADLPHVEHYRSIPEALTALSREDLVFVIGGGQLYTQMLGRADFLYLTMVDQTLTGDTFFPPYEQLIGTTFRLIRREEHEGYAFEDYERAG